MMSQDEVMGLAGAGIDVHVSHFGKAVVFDTQSANNLSVNGPKRKL